jgi:hypothetical protein
LAGSLYYFINIILQFWRLLTTNLCKMHTIIQMASKAKQNANVTDTN